MALHRSSSLAADVIFTRAKAGKLGIHYNNNVSSSSSSVEYQRALVIEKVLSGKQIDSNMSALRKKSRNYTRRVCEDWHNRCFPPKEQKQLDAQRMITGNEYQDLIIDMMKWCSHVSLVGLVSSSDRKNAPVSSESPCLIERLQKLKKDFTIVTPGMKISHASMLLKYSELQSIASQLHKDQRNETDNYFNMKNLEKRSETPSQPENTKKLPIQLLSSQDFQNHGISVPQHIVLRLRACSCNKTVESIVKQYQNAISIFKTNMMNLGERYADVIYCESLLGGWSVADHLRFTVITKRYKKNFSAENPRFPQGITLRGLIFERLELELGAEFSRNVFLAHESWIERMKSYLHQRELALSALRDHVHNINDTSICVIDEFESILKENLENREELEKFNKMRAKQMNSVLEWKRSKLQALRNEKRAEEKRAYLMQKRLEEEARKETLRRRHLKHDLDTYHQKKLDASRQQVLLQEAKARRDALAKSEKATVNTKRINYRKKKIEIKKKAALLDKEVLLAEARERDRRLETLRRSVRPNISSDSERIKMHTISSRFAHDQAALERNERDHSSENRSFNNKGFTDKQILRDPRVRIAAALRAAGLQNSNYGREMLNKVRIKHPSDRLHQSSIFKEN